MYRRCYGRSREGNLTEPPCLFFVPSLPVSPIPVIPDSDDALVQNTGEEPLSFSLYSPRRRSSRNRRTLKTGTITLCQKKGSFARRKDTRTAKGNST
ncbi:hypothetical protein FKM82_016215 [Ascaphus truei]